MEIFWEILQDAAFAAVAAIGFAAISNPPVSAFKWFALIAGAGHATRWVMTHCFAWHIVSASLAGAFLIGLLAVLIAPRAKVPPETFSFPSLLPMIPGVFGYKCIQAIVMLVVARDETTFDHYCYLAISNGVTFIFVILSMVIGQMIPILVFKHISFTSTRKAVLAGLHHRKSGKNKSTKQ